MKIEEGLEIVDSSKTTALYFSDGSYFFRQRDDLIIFEEKEILVEFLKSCLLELEK